MERRSIFKKLNDRASNKDILLAKYARELIELGLKIEEATELNQQSDGENGLENLSEDLKNLLQTLMTWGLETKFLVQFLVENKIGTGADKSLDFMDQAKEKAKSYVKKLIVDAEVKSDSNE